MDLRSIINTDSNSNPPPRLRASQDSPVKQVYHNQQHPLQNGYDGSASIFHEDLRPNTRPPQPPPLQPPSHRDLQSPSGSYSQRSAQSPYQSTPASSVSGNQYPFPQAPHHQGQNHPGYGAPFQQREQHTTITTTGVQGYGQPSPSILTPTSITPGSAYAHQQYHRPHSSHSAATPTSAQSHVQNFPRDSPHALHTQVNPPPHAYPAQHYQSQPGTPLGPPPPIGRPSPVQHREPSGPALHEYRSQSGSSYSSHQVPGPSPTTETPITVLASPAAYNTRQPPSRGQSYRSEEDRERSLSVSPKTRLPSQTKLEEMEVTLDTDRRWSGGVTPAKRKMTESFPEARPFIPPTTEQTQMYYDQSHEPRTGNGLTLETCTDPGRNIKETQVVRPQQPLHTLSPTMASISVIPHLTRESDHLVPQAHPSSGSSSATPSRQQPTTPQLLTNQKTPGSHTSPTPPSTGHLTPSLSAAPSGNPGMPSSMERTISPATTASPQQPTRKRQRFDSPPIYAQSSRRNGRVGSANPLLPNRRPVPPRVAPPMRQEGHETRDQGSLHSAPPVNESNGHPPTASDIVVPNTQPISANQAALGAWEHSIIDMLPSEELTRTIADFLFTEVVLRNDVGAGSAGGGSGHGAVLEIEAKFGQLIDKNTNERLRLPVMTECIISKNDPNLRIAFKSSMTETQHRGLNQFLNEALKKSLPGFSSAPKPRIPMTYVHTKECDTFYELSQSGELSLPPSIRSQLIPRHNKAKVRITTDQKTGRELAKIVKVRVADLDVHSPKTNFDWRVSINLEMKYEGDNRDLVEVTEGGKRAPERNKDRMTYRHLAYQIDLTQVTLAEATSNSEKEHELEIELSTAEVRKHGNLLKGGQANGYEDLVKGFVDNVEILFRASIVRPGTRHNRSTEDSENVWMRKPKSGGWEHHRVTPRARISEPEAFHKPKRLAHRELFKAAAAKSNTMFTGSKTVPSILPSDSVCLRCWARFSTSKSIKNRRSFSSSQPIQEFVLSKVPWRRISPRAYFSANGLLDVTRGQVYNSIQPIPSASQNGVSITKSVKASHVLQNPPSADTPIDRKASDLLDRRKRRNTGGRNGTSDKEPSIPLDASAQLAALSTSLPPSSLRRRLSTLLSLSKPRLTFLMVLTTATAYSLYPVPAVLLPSTSVSPSLSALALVFLTSGTALCSASANALNMLMEPQHDAKMSRTRNRPLVRGLISKRGALVFAGAAGILGVGGLWFGVNPTVAFLGGLNIFLYAGVYTPMKRISVLNTWVGAVVGSIPPLMGWAAAAGQSATGNGAWEELLLGNDNVGGWLLAGLLFAWQFPHFNALSWTIRDEYKNAGYRMLSWTNSKMNGRVALRYSLLFFPICIGLTWYGVTDQGFIITSTVVNAWIVREAWRFWKNEGQKGSARGLFWASVWHLPIVMVLAMAHKKGLWEGIWRRAFGEGDDEDLWEDEAEVEASRPTMPLSPTAI